MKVYIMRRGKPDFVCHAPTIAAAIICYWFATGATPKPSYRVHFGRRRKAKVVSAAIAYWSLRSDMRPSLYDVLEANSTEKQFNEFCELTIQAAELLGN